MIPKVVYFTHKNEKAQKFSEIISNNKKNNSELTFIFYDNEARSKFIKEYYPEFYKFYIRIHPDYGAVKADIFRVLILYHNGGIYIDIKTKIFDIYKQIENYSFCCGTYDDKLMFCYNYLCNFFISNFFISSEKKGTIITNIKNEMYNRLSNFEKTTVLPNNYNFLYGTAQTGQRAVFFYTGPGFSYVVTKFNNFKIILNKKYLIYDDSNSIIDRIINSKKIYKNRYHISNNKMII